MNLLLDTHTFLWFINDDEALSPVAKTLIEVGDNDVFLSIASLWEMAIKVSLGKLSVPAPFAEFMSDQVRENNIQSPGITPEHTGVVATLPFHHRDPFDRLIVAQAIVEKMPIVGKDQPFLIGTLSSVTGSFYPIPA
jgi:PIN domain nuclease of toxin-antitoxin system